MRHEYELHIREDVWHDLESIRNALAWHTVIIAATSSSCSITAMVRHSYSDLCYGRKGYSAHVEMHTIKVASRVLEARLSTSEAVNGLSAQHL